MKLDTWLEKHLDTWLDHAIPQDEIEGTKQAMLSFIASLDETEAMEWIDRGWRAVSDEAIKK